MLDVSYCCSIAAFVVVYGLFCCFCLLLGLQKCTYRIVQNTQYAVAVLLIVGLLVVTFVQLTRD